VFFGHLLDPAELRAAIESHRAWCDDMLAQLGEVRSELGADARWRNAALVAEWGLDYYRGERAAVDGIEHAVSPLPEGPEAPVEPDEPGAELAG
jgi:hypothetical protein